jgi:hypothetical protein
VEAVLRAYAGVYERRRVASRAGEIFRNSEANAIAALALVQISAAGASPLSRRDSVTTLATLTERILVQEAHAPATDIAGLAWVSAYGTLEIQHPPLEQIEVVLESGNASGAIAGVYASAWRSVFLATAMSLFNWRHRPVAERQLVRWLEYMTPKAVGISEAETLGTSQAARIAYVLAALAERTHSERLREAARKIAGQAFAAQRQDGSIEGEQAENATAVAAQVVVAARAVGDEQIAARGLEYLIGPRLEPRRRLLWAVEADNRFELSPWVPLALVGTQRPST